MARPVLTDEQRRETRRKIRDAAATLYAEKGLANISARAVAEKAGVSVGTLYSYFSNLSELLQSLWRKPARHLVQNLEQLAQEYATPVDRLRALLEAYTRFAVEERSVFRSAFLFVRPESYQAPPQVSLEDDRFFRVFQKAIADGQQDGSFRSGDTNKLTQMVISGVHGAIALPVNLHRLSLDSSQQVPKDMIEALLEWLQAK